MIKRTPTKQHITLEQAKAQLRIDLQDSSEDEDIKLMIEAANGLAENYIEKAIALSTCVSTEYDFAGSTITILDGNLISITSIKADGVTISEDRIKIYEDHFVLELSEGIDCEELVVTYEAGYAVETCPKPIQRAILIKIVDLYDTERGSYTLTLQNNQTFEMILNYYKPYLMQQYK